MGGLFVWRRLVPLRAYGPVFHNGLIDRSLLKDTPILKRISILCLSVLSLSFEAQGASVFESQYCQDLYKAAKGEVLYLPLKGVDAAY